MSDHPFRTLSSKTIFRNHWIDLVEDQVEVLETEHRFTYTYLASKPSVMVVALTPRREVVLVHQYRYPTGRYSYELPGGGSGGGDVKAAALRELEEETGYRAESIEKVGEFVVYCGLADEICHVFVADELTGGQQTLDKTEQIEVREVGWDTLDRMIEDGEFRDGMGLAALNLARRAVGARLGE